MTWVRIDDRAATHPKLRDAGPEASWLWVCGLCWCNGHHTDGVIRIADLEALSPGTWKGEKLRSLAAKLVEVGLWMLEGDFEGYRVHDYAEYQEQALRESVDERRRYEREKKQAQRAAKKAAKTGPPPDVSPGDTSGHVPGTTPGPVPPSVPAPVPTTVPSAVSPPPDPARPGPTRPDPALEQRTRDAGPIAEMERLRKLARSALIEGYRDRFERATAMEGHDRGEPWMGLSKATSDIDTVTHAILARGGEQAIAPRVAKLLDGAFADPWMIENRWPWGAIAKNPTRYLAPGPRANGRSSGYVALKANPADHPGEFGDDDIPTAAGPQKVIGYG